MNTSNVVIKRVAGNQIDPETFVKEYYENLGYEVRRGARVSPGVGVPDFFVSGNGEEFFVEVKGAKDSIRIQQLVWWDSNPDKKVVLFVVDIHNCLKNTVVLGYKETPDQTGKIWKVPIIACARVGGDSFYFWCDFCKRLHTHGAMDGHRWAHCSIGDDGEESPYEHTGYILKHVSEDGV